MFQINISIIKLAAKLPVMMYVDNYYIMAKLILNPHLHISKTFKFRIKTPSFLYEKANHCQKAA